MSKLLTLQTEGVKDVSTTVRFDEAVALDANGVEEKVLSAGFANVIVCPVFASIGNVWVTGVAAEKLAFPGCVAVITHVPVETGVIFNPETVHTPVVWLVRVTVKPLFDEAPESNAGLVGAFAPGLLNVIACAAAAIANVIVYVLAL
jgi:hypothetical protein